MSKEINAERIVKESKAVKSDELKKLEKEMSKKYDTAIIDGIKEPPEMFYIPTGAFELDCALGSGGDALEVGYPSGKVIILAAPFSCGKSTMSLKAAANAQKMGKKVAYIDTEASFDKKWAAKLGVNVNELTLISSNLLEEAGEMAIDLAKSGLVDLIILDSIGAASIKPIEEGTLAENYIGMKAKKIGFFLCRITGHLYSNNVCFIITNHLKANIGDTYNPWVMPGGYSLSYAASQIIYLTRSQAKEKDGDAEMADDGSIVVRASIKKNKISVPFKKADFVIRGTGEIDESIGIAKMLKEHASKFGVDATGAWYTVPASITGTEDMKLQGEKGIRTFLDSDPIRKEKIKQIILDTLCRKA